MATNTHQDPEDNCPECGSTKREFITGFKGDISEPPSCDSENCFDCGHEFDEMDEATKRGI